MPQVEGVDVMFPVQPLDAQHLVMAAAVRAMLERNVAFVESPTGLVGQFCCASLCLSLIVRSVDKILYM